MQTENAIDAILADLNDEQRTAAGHGRGPLLIVAGAGTGKTATLAHRVAALIATGIDPGRILLLTFTRRAAAEMLRRVDQILDGKRTASGRRARRAVLGPRRGGFGAGLSMPSPHACCACTDDR